MKRFCIECGHEIDEGRTTCPNCGCPVYDTAKNDSNDEEHYEDNDEPWYNTDLFSGVVTPLMRNFDNWKILSDYSRNSDIVIVISFYRSSTSDCILYI